MTVHPPRRRRLRHAIKWVGLALSVVLLVAWLVTRWFSTDVTLTNGRSKFSASATCGQASLSWGGISPYPRMPWKLSATAERLKRPHLYWSPKFVLHDTMGNQGMTFEISMLIMPFWLLFLLSAAPSAYLYLRDRRTARIASPCLHCSYSLAGLAPGSPCPECGRVVGAT